jgi:hypothetical protein
MGTDFDKRSGAMGVHSNDVTWEYRFIPPPADPDDDKDSDV